MQRFNGEMASILGAPIYPVIGNQSVFVLLVGVVSYLTPSEISLVDAVKQPL